MNDSPRPCIIMMGGNPVATGNFVINEPPEEEPEPTGDLWRNEPLEFSWTVECRPSVFDKIQQHIMRQVWEAAAWPVGQRRLPRKKKKQLKKLLEKESGCKIKIRYTHKK